MSDFWVRCSRCSFHPQAPSSVWRTLWPSSGAAKPKVVTRCLILLVDAAHIAPQVARFVAVIGAEWTDRRGRLSGKLSSSSYKSGPLTREICVIVSWSKLSSQWVWRESAARIGGKHMCVRPTAADSLHNGSKTTPQLFPSPC